jgi:hypothetical protein
VWATVQGTFKADQSRFRITCEMPDGSRVSDS